ncbi:alpha-amylase family protein [Streptomyces sp. ODS28]|uniref:alpha-amylase n=1 Tax=Streptomyces sp. ODS28 TaxID=3136688 RepID=UPI0031E7E210
MQRTRDRRNQRRRSPARRRLAVGSLAGVLAAGGLYAVGPWESQAQPPGQKTVTATLFERPYADVAEQCKSALGPAGYGYVEVSPATEHIAGNQWWTSYQPVSYKIAGRLGGEDDFRKMVSACHGAGVKVIADAVINHMSSGSGTGTGGTKYSKYAYPGTYKDGDFHGCRKDISNYNDRQNVQTCELVGLSDLDTGSDHVQSTVAKYLDSLRGMGVDGFRVDAAKHIAADDMKGIQSKMSDPGFWVSEVIYGGGEAVKPEEYTGLGDVDEFRFGTHVKSAFQDRDLGKLGTIGDDKVESGKARSFVDNWDTERNGTTLTYKDGASYKLANAFMLAHPYGSPNVFSGYEWSDKDAGPPKGDSGWTNMHKDPLITGMVGFRNAVGGAKLTGWQAEGGTLSFAREGKGFLALNAGDGEMKRTFATTLPGGTYCNVAKASPGKCEGNTVKVGEDGKAQATVPAGGALALHVKAKG